MGGDKDEPRRLVAVGQRQAGLGGAAERGGHARHDHDRNVGLAQMVKLLAAATEDEGIATLEPNDAAPAARGLDQAAIDLVLANTGLAAALAYEHLLRVPASTIEDA